MAPPGSSQVLLSPAELSYIHSSLSLKPPIRPDLRSNTQFRPLVAEADILPAANGSARVCFSDGTEAIVGVKAEVEKSERQLRRMDNLETDLNMNEQDDSDGLKTSNSRGSDRWLEISVELSGFRDDDNLPVFLSSMLSDTLLASPYLMSKLYINSRWHWKLYIDILLLSPPLSYPLPLLSLTTHLALLNTKLPKRTSDPEDDPIFDDDWKAAIHIYSMQQGERPPVTLLVMTVDDNVIFDPTKDELAVAESTLAVSVAMSDANTVNSGELLVKVLAIRTIDPPSRMTPPGINDFDNPATAPAMTPEISGTPRNSQRTAISIQETIVSKEKGKVWTPPRGGMKRHLLTRIIKQITEKAGVAEEVMAGLASVNT